MDSIFARTATGFSRPRRSVLQSPQSLGIEAWSTVLTSIPKSHPILPSRARMYATGSVHEKASKKMRFAPRRQYQPTSASTWIISDGTVSADKEAIALAKGLSLPWAIKRVQWRHGLQWLPIPFKKLIMDYHHVVNRKQTDKLPWFLKGDQLGSPYPSFVIGSGAKTLPGLLHVSRMSGKASFSAHLHFPALPFIHFDQVFLQRHEIVVQLASLGLMKDQKNYFRINSTLNTTSPKSLEQAKTLALEQGLIPKSYFQKPALREDDGVRSLIVTVLIGGPNEDCSHHTDRIVSRLRRLLEAQRARVLLSFSQRTAENTKKAIMQLQEQIQDPERFFVYDPMVTVSQSDKSSSVGEHEKMNKSHPGPVGATGFSPGRNPYEAMLALADKIVVTADSVAMTNEALATGKPVYVMGAELARGKVKVFQRYLADAHYTRAFRPGRIPIIPTNTTGKSSTTMNDTADPLSYPGDHPPWVHTLAGQGPVEARMIADRIKVLREARISGRRAPAGVAEATC